LTNSKKTKTEILTFTDKAKERINNLLKKAPKGTLGIRFGVKSGGCSGMAYEVNYTSEEKPSDEKVIFSKAVVYIDSSATLFLIGSEVDWNTNDLQSGFIFNNPNELARCGCGESFTI